MYQLGRVLWLGVFGLGVLGCLGLSWVLGIWVGADFGRVNGVVGLG